MNLPCETIRDLLPLYHDHVCSPQSRELVEEHLASCEQCQEELSALRAEMKGVNTMENTKPMRDIAKQWKRDKKTSFLKGSLLVSILASLSCILSYEVIGSYVAPDGTLVEPFALIPLAYLFALLAILFGLGLGMVSMAKRLRKRAQNTKA